MAGVVELGDTEAVRVGYPLQQDLRGGRLVGGARRFEGVHERTEILLEQVVAEVHHEVVVAQEVGGDEDAVGQAEGRVLRDERDLRTPLRAVAERGHHLVARVADDDADFGDARRHHRLDAIEQDGFVGHRYQLFGAGVRDGP